MYNPLKINLINILFKYCIFGFHLCPRFIYKFDNYIRATYALSIFFVQSGSLSHQSDDITIFPTLHSSTGGNYSPRCIRCIKRIMRTKYEPSILSLLVKSSEWNQLFCRVWTPPCRLYRRATGTEWTVFYGTFIALRLFGVMETGYPVDFKTVKKIILW